MTDKLLPYYEVAAELVRVHNYAIAGILTLFVILALWGLEGRKGE